MSLKRKAADAAASETKKVKPNTSITAFFGSQEASKPIDFDKAKWIASLTPEQKDLLKLEIQTLHDSWLPYLKDELTTPEFLNLKRFLKRERANGATVFPPNGDIYSWYVAVVVSAR